MNNTISYIKSFRFNLFTFKRRTTSIGPIISLVNVKKIHFNNIVINNQSILKPIQIHRLSSKEYKPRIKNTVKTYSKRKILNDLQ